MADHTPTPETTDGSGAGTTAAGLRPATVAVTAGRPAHEPDQPLNVPLVPAATYVAGGDREYGRYGNPTWEAFEEVLGGLEGGRALGFSTGMAAITCLLDLVGTGAGVVLPRHAYLGSTMAAADLEGRGRLRTTLVDVTDPDAVAAACDDDVALLWLESPTNPALEVADLERLAAIGHAAGATVVVDNTFATPLRQRPLDLGADVVVHSATKYLAGHSDALLGALVTRDDGLHQVLSDRRRLTGAVPGTLEAFLAVRGMRTLHLRLDRAEENARVLAARAAEHPAVAEVRYPGFGAIVALVLAGAEEGEGPGSAALAGDLLVRSTALWVHATSLGGVESTFERRRRWRGEAATIPQGLVRLSVGVEDVEDLWDDLARGLDRLTR
ncbi:PLP-dependent aspartate aminotransferase family protein [Nocardioides sp.]|uniref:trans-sulfuration enzyme family protein n=1 Tax=Nocardioides sp. TaxID=35761 RepID=UPI0035117C04